MSNVVSINNAYTRMANDSKVISVERRILQLKDIYLQKRTELMSRGTVAVRQVTHDLITYGLGSPELKASQQINLSIMEEVNILNIDFNSSLALLNNLMHDAKVLNSK